MNCNTISGYKMYISINVITYIVIIVAFLPALGKLCLGLPLRTIFMDLVIKIRLPLQRKSL